MPSSSDEAQCKWEEEIVLSGSSCPEDTVGELRIKIRELPMADGVHASTGCQLWNASVELAKELLRRQQLIKDKRVLEVGTGCGLLGIVCARLAKSTLLTDCDEEVVRNCQHNLENNLAAWSSKTGEPMRKAYAKCLDWKDASEKAWNLAERAEVIVASDVIYGHWGETVGQAFINMLSPGGLIMLAVSEDRRSGLAGFQATMNKANYRIEETKVQSSAGQFRFYECHQREPSVADNIPPLVTKERSPQKPPKTKPAEKAKAGASQQAQAPAKAGKAPPEKAPSKAKAAPAPKAETASQKATPASSSKAPAKAVGSPDAGKAKPSSSPSPVQSPVRFPFPAAPSWQPPPASSPQASPRTSSKQNPADKRDKVRVAEEEKKKPPPDVPPLPGAATATSAATDTWVWAEQGVVGAARLHGNAFGDVHCGDVVTEEHFKIWKEKNHLDESILLQCGYIKKSAQKAVLKDAASKMVEAAADKEAGANSGEGGGETPRTPPPRPEQERRSSEQEDAGKLVSPNARGRRQELTLEQATAVVVDMIKAFRESDFQRRLQEIDSTEQKNSKQWKTRRSKLQISVQTRILPSHGFEGSLQGVKQLMKALTPWQGHPSLDEHFLRLSQAIGVSEASPQLGGSQQPKTKKELAEADQPKVETEHLKKLEAERAEQDRVEKEKAEKDKAEKDRLEKEEKDRLEKERLEKEEKDRLEKERLERDRLEKEENARLEKERLEKDEKERLDKERLEKEHKERLEKERLAKEEEERLEKERLEREEKERLEKERLEKEEQGRLEKERLEKEEKERLERERLEKEEKERLEKERLEKEENERLEKERLEKEEKERLEKERLDKEQKERLEKERLEKEEQERLEKERLEKEEEDRLEKERLEKERLEKEEKQQLEKEQNERLEKERLEKLDANEAAIAAGAAAEAAAKAAAAALAAVRADLAKKIAAKAAAGTVVNGARLLQAVIQVRPNAAVPPLALAPAPPKTAEANLCRWRVVGGKKGNGIIVREAVSITSPSLGQLEHGSLVGELEKQKERVRYRLLSGTGPAEGWVSLTVKGAKMLEIEPCDVSRRKALEDAARNAGLN